MESDFVLIDMRWLSRSILSVINAISKLRCLSFCTPLPYSRSRYVPDPINFFLFQFKRTHHDIAELHQHGYPLGGRKEQFRQFCRTYKSFSMDYIAKFIRVIVILIAFHNSLFQQLTIIIITTFQYTHLMDGYLV